MKMSFGNAPIELMAGAENAVKCAWVCKPGEHVALIADEISRSVAASLEKALTERGAEFTGLLLEDFGPRPMKGAPEPVLEALENRRRGRALHDAAAGRAKRSNVHRKSGGAPADSLRAHGRRDSRNHAGRNARGLPTW